MKRTTLLCTVLLACGGSTTGDDGLAVDLSFADDVLPAPPGISWRLSVEWPDGSARREGSYVPGEPLTVPAVPHGPSRQVSVELFTNDGHVYYHGRSEPFDFDGGSQRVAVVLQSSPGGSINIIGAAGAFEDAADITHTRTVTLNIQVDFGTRVRVSHDAITVRDQGEERELTDLMPWAGGGYGYRWEGWQLDATPCCDASQPDPSACAPRNECKQPTSVYAVLFDDDDYPSEILEATIDFDSRNWSCPDGAIGSGVCVPTCGDLLLDPCDRAILVDATSSAAADQQDGITWSTAFSDLQTALGVAAPGDEIWVAAGVYPPDEGPLATDEDSESTFQLKESVGMYGCFSGSEAIRDQRNCAAHETLLWGDLDGEPSINAATAYHVVRAGQVSDATILDGFVITDGYADGGNTDDAGGGMYIRDGQPTIRNCVFRNNSAMRGGGLYADNSAALFVDVTFEDNRALFAGGGVAVRGDHAPTFEDCTFARNRVSGSPSGPDDHWGGAGLNVERTPNASTIALTMHRCRFVGNEATNTPGGAIYSGASLVSSTRTSVFNSLFLGNRAQNGGAVYNQGTGAIELINVTMASNCNSWYRNDAAVPEPVEECLFGDTLFQGTVHNADVSGTVVLANIISWNNAPTELIGTIEATYSCVAGGATGAGNIDCNPSFIDADGADDVPGTVDDDLRLSAGSPAIDAGDNREVPVNGSLDLDGEARFVDDPATTDTGIGAGPVVDMGAYEYH